jgi:HEPN domain-containing protein
VEEFAANSNIGDGIVGFHAQQAIEKWIKAVLAAHSVRYEYGHDLRYFIELVEDAGLAFPFTTPAVVALSEYAVPLRYEDLLDEEPLVRRAAPPIGALHR